jgi:hypothetical protein
MLDPSAATHRYRTPLLILAGCVVLGLLTVSLTSNYRPEFALKLCIPFVGLPLTIREALTGQGSTTNKLALWILAGLVLLPWSIWNFTLLMFAIHS